MPSLAELAEFAARAQAAQQAVDRILLDHERTRLVTQIKARAAPRDTSSASDKDRDFWDVMDEEWDSNIRFFEDPKPNPDEGRPSAPDADFWIDQILKAPLAADHAYFDPIPSDDLDRRFLAAVQRLVDRPIARLGFYARFQTLQPLNRQQALRFVENMADGSLPPEMAARMQEAEDIERALKFFDEPVRDTVRHWVYALPRGERQVLLEGIRNDPGGGELPRLVKLADLFVRAKQPFQSPAPPRGPGLPTIIKQAHENMKKHAVLSKL